MKKHITMIKYVVIFLTVGFFSPSVQTTMDLRDGTYEIGYTILNRAEAGGMRVSGMRGGGAGHSGMSRGGFSSSRMRVPSLSRYQGGNFHRSSRPAVTRPKSIHPINRPSTKPVKKPTTSSIKKPVKPVNGKQPLHGKPLNNKPLQGKPSDKEPLHGKPSHHRPPHNGHHSHGHHSHWHHPPHYYPGWDGYWPWFWGSSIVVGAIVSAIPDDGCRDVNIDGILYKECEGVLFEPVYEDDDVGYKVVKIEK